VGDEMLNFIDGAQETKA